MSGSSEVSRTSWPAWVGLAGLLSGYLMLILATGAPGSPLVPVLPEGVRPAAWIVRGSRWLGLSSLSRTQLTAAAIGVVAAVLLAFAVVMLESWRGRVRLAWVVVGAALALGLAVAAPPLLSRDVYSYAAYGRILAVHDSNPYLFPPSAFPGDPFVAVASPEWVDTRSVYGPVFTEVSAGIAGAWRGSPEGTIFGFKLLAGMAVMGAMVLVARAAKAVSPGREAAAAAVIGLNPVLVLHTVGGGHNDALIAVCFAGAFAIAVSPKGRTHRGRVLAVTVLLTLAVLVKAVVAPLLVLWLWQVWRGSPREARVRTLALHLGSGMALSAAAFLPVQAGWATVRSLLSVTSRQGWASGPGLVARAGRALGQAIGGRATGAAFDAAASVLFAAVFLVLFWRLLRRAPARVDADRWGGTVLLLALAAPYLLPWYAAWFVPFLALMQDDVLAAAGLMAGGLLCLTGIPAEAGSTPQVWHDMVLAVHDVAAPVMLGLLAVVGWRMARLARSQGRTPVPAAPASDRS